MPSCYPQGNKTIYRHLELNADNALRPIDHSLPQVYLDAITEGKRLGLEQ